MTTNLKIGFIGLGNMGTPIAKNLIAAGLAVSVYNRSSEKTEVFQTLNATIATTPQAVAMHADVVVTMLSDDTALNQVCKEVVPALKSGAIHFSMSTVAPSTVEALLPLHHLHNVMYVAAPVLGRPPAAEARLLSVLLSGRAEAKQIVKPIVEAISQNNFDCGENPATASAVKLALNLMVFTNIELLTEVMLFAEKSGIDKTIMTTIINNTALASPVLKTYGKLIAEEQDKPGGFATQLASKDVRLLQETAARVGLKLPLADLVRNHLEESISLGKGTKDISLIIQNLRKKLST
jgi:3-hydroxyisobutyrate dehydrogenase-like beta-hydroxyacid dehydrogenase